jgi:hypothetical protein
MADAFKIPLPKLRKPAASGQHRSSGTSSRSEPAEPETEVKIPQLTAEEERHQIEVALDFNDEEFARLLKQRATKTEIHAELMEAHENSLKASIMRDAPLILEMRNRLDNTGHRADLISRDKMPGGKPERSPEYKLQVFGAKNFTHWVNENYHCTARWMNKKLAEFKRGQEEAKRYLAEQTGEQPETPTAPVIEGTTNTESPPQHEPRRKSVPDAQDIRRWKEIAETAVKHIDAEPEDLRRAIAQAQETIPIPHTPIDADQLDLTDNQYITLSVLRVRATLNPLEGQAARYKKVARIIAEEIMELASVHPESEKCELAS